MLKILTDIIHECIQTPEFRRLQGVSFLGILDYIPTNRTRSSRFEHSLAVSGLCHQYADHQQLPLREKIHFVLAGLLHDLGHAPLSHSLEPIFKERFNIDHHLITKRHIFESSNLARIWLKYRLDPDYIWNMLEGTDDSAFDILAKSPINFDTLDGIPRTEMHFNNSNERASAGSEVCSLLCNESSWDVILASCDSFWEEKHRVYSSYIYNEKNALCEKLIQSLFRIEEQLSLSDFYLDDSALFLKYEWMRETIQDVCRKRIFQNHKFQKSGIRNKKLDVRRRIFMIDSEQKTATFQDFKNRYHSYNINQVFSFHHDNVYAAL